MDIKEFIKNIQEDNFSSTLIGNHNLDQIKEGDFIAHISKLEIIKNGYDEFYLGSVYKIEKIENRGEDYNYFYLLNCFSEYRKGSYNTLKGLNNYILIKFEENFIDLYPDE